MKNLLWIALAAIVLIGGYVLVTGKTPADMIDTASDAIEAPGALEETAAEPVEPAAGDVEASEPEVAVDVDAAAEDTADAVETGAGDILENADGAMSAVEDTAGGVAASAEDAAAAAAAGAKAAVDAMAEEGSDAMQVVDEAVQDATDAASGAVDAAEGAQTATEEAADAAADSAADTATSPDAEVNATDPADATVATGPLSVQNFDMQAAADMIDNSEIGDMQKTLLKATLKKAQDNPDLLKAAIEQARAALGM